MENVIDDLETLHSRLIDACSGYEEGAELAERQDIVDLFDTLRDMHGRHAAQLGTFLAERGIEAEDDESLLALVHKSILRIRSIVTGLDRNIIPGIIDGEERIATIYDKVIATMVNDEPLKKALTDQRADLAARIEAMRELEIAGRNKRP